MPKRMSLSEKTHATLVGEKPLATPKRLAVTQSECPAASFSSTFAAALPLWLGGASLEGDEALGKGGRHAPCGDIDVAADASSRQ